MENVKHVAWRTCIATGEKKDKREMIRLVKQANGVVVVDQKGKEKGRGASICMDMGMFDIAVKKKAIERALRLGRKLSEQEVIDIRVAFQAAINERQLRKGENKVSLKISKSEFDKIAK